MKRDDIANLLNLKLNNGLYCGEIKKYPVQLDLMNQGYVNVTVLHILVEPYVTKQQLQMIAHETGLKNRIDGHDDFVTIILSDLYGKVKVEKRAKVVDNIHKVIDALSRHQIPPVSSCHICCCEKEEALVMGVRSVRNYPQVPYMVHDSCINEVIDKKIAEIQQNNNNKENRALSIILAFIGCFLATLLLFLVAIFGGVWLGILFALVPLAGYLGYKIGKGPRDKTSVITIILASILFPVLMFIGMAYLISVGANSSIGQAFSELLQDILVCAVFLAIGIGINIQMLLKNTNEAKLKNLKK